MKALLLSKIAKVEDNPLELVEVPIPKPQKGEILIKVLTCGVCHTDIDEIEGRCMPKLPIILGHQIVGKVETLGQDAHKFKIGDRVGVAWIYSSCGKCNFCLEGRENLCENFKATGCHANGGYAEYTVVPEEYAYKIPDNFSSEEAAPLLCAGVIGYRALRLTGIKNGESLGLFGFGASAHIVIQIVKYLYPDSKVYVFTREGQTEHQELAKKLGAYWVGTTEEDSPEKLNYAIDFTPAWKPITVALRNIMSGGRLVINAIRKEDGDKATLLNLDYGRDLWLEKEIKSTANVTRRDAEEFLEIASKIPIRPKVQVFDLEDANYALKLLKDGKIEGAGVLKIS